MDIKYITYNIWNILYEADLDAGILGKVPVVGREKLREV